MRYLNRINAGLELFFGGCGPLFRGLSQLNMQDIDDDLAHESPFFRALLAFTIGRFLHKLRRTSPDTALAVIPPQLEQCERPHSIFSRSSFGALSAFFGWLHGISNANEQARIASLSDINDTASRLDELSRSVCKTVFTLNNQRVFIERTGEDITLSLAEREWGRISVRFTNCSGSDLPPLPAMGYAFCIESKVTDSTGYSINILLDTYFSQIDYAQRLFDGSGWHELCFDCSDIRATFSGIDYAGRMSRMGAPRIELIENAFRALVNKAGVLGSGGLTQGEQETLPLARLIHGANGLLDGKNSPEPAAFYEQLIIETLENRYAMQRISSFLHECGCDKLRDELSAAEASCYDNHEREAVKNAEIFAVDLEHHAYDGSARKLLYSLFCAVIDMTSSLSADTLRQHADSRIDSALCAAVQPLLREKGFDGDYPNYHRRSGEMAEYISVLTYNEPAKPNRGILHYRASIAAAQISAAREDELLNAGIPRAELRATDSLTEGCGIALYSELAGRDDASAVSMEVDLYSTDDCVLTRDESSSLTYYASMAISQFDRGCIPQPYRKRRRHALRFGRSFWRCFADGAPFGVLTALAMLLAFLIFENGDSAKHTYPMLTSLCLGAAVGVLSGIAYWRSRTRKLWRF